MQFSADGSLVASTAADGTLLFDLRTHESTGEPLGKGTLVETTKKDGFVIYQVTDASGKDFIHIRVWSTGEERGIPIAGSSPRLIPNTKILVFRTTDQDTRLTQYHLWSLIANRELDLLPESEPYFSPNRQILAYQTTDQDTGQTFLHLWNIANEKSIGEAIEGSFVGISNQTLLSQTYNSDTGETLINLWNIREAAKIKTVASNSFRTSQDSDVLVFMTQDSAGSYINSIDTATGDILFQPEPGDAIHDLSPNGKVLLYESAEGGSTSLRALNARTGGQIGNPLSGSLNQHQFLGPLLIYEAYTTNPNGNNDYQFSLVNTTTAAILGDPIAGSYNSVTLLQDDSSLIYQTSDDKWNFLNINGGSKSTQLGGAYLASTPDGEILAYQTFEGDSSIINLWDIEKNRKIGGPIKGKYLAMSPDSTVITQSETFALNFWDVTRTLIFGEPVTEKSDQVLSAALSPDGKMLVLADSDGITIMDAASNKMLKTLSGVHDGAVTSVRLSPDKNTLLTVGEDGKTIAWDLRTFRQLLDPITGTNSDFSPQGKFLVVVDESKNTTAVWDVAGQKPVGENFSGQIIIFSSDEKYMVILDGTKNTAALWKLPTGPGTEVALPPAQSAVFGPDSKTLALINGNIVTLWDLTSQGTIGEPFAGSSVTFSTNGRTVAIQGNGINDRGSIILFDLTKQQTIGEPIPGYLNSNPDAEDTFLVVDGTSNTTTFWEWDTGKLAKSIVGADINFTKAKIDTLVVRDEKTEKKTLWNPATLEQIGQALAGTYFPSVSPDGTLISMADSNRKKTIVWNLKTQEQVVSIPGYYSPTFCTDNKTVAWFDGASTTVTFWVLEADQTLQSLGALKLSEESTEDTVAITFGPGCKKAAIQDSSLNQTILWDVTKNKAINEAGIDGSDFARFSSDGSTVAIFNDNNADSTTFWKVADASQIGEKILGNPSFAQENSQIMSVEKYDRTTDSYTYTMWDLDRLKQIGEELHSYIEPTFTADGNLIIYGKNGVTFWNLAEHKITGKPLRGHSAPVTNMLFSPDSKTLASLASDGIALTNLDQQKSTHLKADYIGRLTGMIAFSQDGRSLTALGEDGTILVWDVADNSPASKNEAPYKEHVNRVYRPTLDPNGQYLVYEYDGGLNIWDIENPQIVENPIKIKNCCGGAISFSPDGNFMFYSDGGTIYQLDQWKIPAKRSKIEISFGRVPFSSLNVVMDPKNLAAPKYLISSSIDAQIWDWAKKSKVSDPISDFQVLGSNARAPALIYLDMDGRLVKWDLNPANWIKTLCAKANRDLSKDEWSQYIGEGNPQPVCPRV